MKGIIINQTRTDALLIPTEFSSVVTRAPSKSHTTPDKRCVKILYKYQVSLLKFL